MKTSHLYISSVLLILLSVSANSQLVRFPINKSHKKSHAPNSFQNLYVQNGTTEIHNLMTMQYFATIEIGSKNEEFSVILDTGSPILWVPDTSLSLSVTHSFDCSDSSTCIADPSDTVSLPYAQGAIEGYKVTDTITIGQLVVPNFNMLIATSISAMPTGAFDGIMGLALNEASPDYPTVLDNLKGAGLINEGTFSMYLGNQAGATGEIIFGGYDPQYALTDFEFVNVEPDSPYWQMELSALGIGNYTNITLDNVSAVFDSGTSVLAFSTDMINQIVQEAQNQGVSCSFSSALNFYTCDCEVKEKLGDLTFYIQNSAFTVSANDYVMSELGQCYLMMQDVGNSIGSDLPIILGDIFLKNYYVLYTADNNTVGLAKAVPSHVTTPWLYLVGMIVLVIVAVLIINRCTRKEPSKTNTNYQPLNPGQASFANNYGVTRPGQEPNSLSIEARQNSQL